MAELARRRANVLELLHSRGEVSVGELRTAMGVGLATVRRDLQALASEGRLLRTYGGAVLPGPPAPRAARPVQNDMYKRQIAAAAADLLADRASLLISGGTTTLALAQRIARRQDLRVVTNSLEIAQLLSHHPGIELVVLGGSYRRESGSLLGYLTEQAAESLRVGTVVTGIGAISTRHGLMNDHIQEVVTDRALLRMGEEVVVLADASKFSRVASAVVLGLGDVTWMVTDSRAPRHVVEELESMGVKVVIAPAREGPRHARPHDGVGRPLGGGA